MYILHTGHEESLCCGTNSIVGAATFLYSYLLKHRYRIPQEDLRCYDVFCCNLRKCIEYRKHTDTITDTITFYNIAALYICSWLGIHAELLSRRKSWESDLMKMLENAIEKPDLISVNDDIFGIRIIALSPENYGTLYTLQDTITQIFTGSNLSIRNTFLNWAKDNLSSITYTLIQSVLSIPVSLTKQKNYVSSPKPNGYQSIHTTLQIDSFCEDPNLRGVFFEIQYRSLDMHKKAEHNPEQSHVSYKNRFPPGFTEIFYLSDHSRCSIPGVSDDMDLDAVFKSADTGKHVAARRTMMTE